MTEPILQMNLEEIMCVVMTVMVIDVGGGPGKVTKNGPLLSNI